MICGQCQAEQPHANRFCGQCGAPLASVAAAPRRSGERRQMTILFYDLVGSTALATRCDPEDFNDAVETFHSEVGAAIRVVGGYVGARVGDGAVVYFGYPDAQEDAADRAVLAGLRAVEVGSAVRLPDGENAQVRIGIATGEGVVNRLENEAAGNEVVGSVGNLAARLQSAAAPGAVVISDDTRRLLRGEYELVDLGGINAKGFAAPVQAWRVVGRADRDVLGEWGEGGEAPLVGRDQEIGYLTEALESVSSGGPRVVLMKADAGLGKSRIVAEIARAAQARGVLRFGLYCSAQTQEAPFWPFIQQMRRAIRLETPVGTIPAAETVMAPQTDPDDVALLAGLVGAPIPESPAVQALNAAQKRDRRIEALIRQVRLFALHVPVLVIFDDAQWGDATSLAVLERFVRSGGMDRTLVLVSARPEFQPAWLGEPVVEELTLSHLGPADSAALVTLVAGSRPLAPSVRRAIVDRADGVPLFIEEITRSALEMAADARDGSTADLKLPMTLQDSLLARLDRLGPAKDLAQIAAVIGRRFSTRALESLGEMTPQAQTEALQRLVGSGLIASERDAGADGYAFKHALFQQTAYGTLLRGDRRRLNARLLRIIEADHPTVVATEPERLAHYATEAGEAETAAGYWLTAGLLALSQSAMTEAASRLRRGLGLLAQAPQEAWRWRLELRLELTLGKALIATVGYANPETGATFARAKVLCEAIGEKPELLAVVHGLWIHEFLRGRFVAARTHADELLRLSEGEQNQSWTLIACRALGALAFPMAEFDHALPILERGLSLYAMDRRTDYAQVLVDDPRVVMLMYLSWVQLYRGQTAEAWTAIRQSLDHARALGQPHSLAYALAGRVLTGLFADHYDGAAPLIAELAELAREHEMAYWNAGAQVLQGRYLVGTGEVEKGGAMLEGALKAYLATGSLLYLPTFIMWTADAAGRLGRIDHALDLIGQAKALMADTGIENDAAEILRVEGELHRRQGDRPAAQAAFEAARVTLERHGAQIHRSRLAASLAAL